MFIQGDIVTNRKELLVPDIACYDDELKSYLLKLTKNLCFSDDYIINGGKMWTTNGAQADWMCVLANTSDGHPHRNKSLIIIPTDSEGFTVERKIDKLGMWSSDTAQSHFDNVRVPQKYRIGEEGFGFMYQMIQFQEERLFAAASCEYY